MKGRRREGSRKAGRRRSGHGEGGWGWEEDKWMERVSAMEKEMLAERSLILAVAESDAGTW